MVRTTSAGGVEPLPSPDDLRRRGTHFAITVNTLFVLTPHIEDVAHEDRTDDRQRACACRSRNAREHSVSALSDAIERQKQRHRGKKVLFQRAKRFASL
jgi:hypothetical protein